MRWKHILYLLAAAALMGACAGDEARSARSKGGVPDAAVRAASSGVIPDQRPRIALIVANQGYPRDDRKNNLYGPLANPHNDAADMAQALTRYGFSVRPPVLDGDLRAMDQALNDLARELRTDPRLHNALVLFYYSGHGAEVDRENYLLPAGRGYRNPSDIKYGALAAQKVLHGLRQAGAGAVILVLDACRSHLALYQGKGGAEQEGLVPLSAHGSLVAFATEPGRSAFGLPGERLSLYTRELIAALDERPNHTFGQVFKRARDRVYLASKALGDRYIQTPYTQDGIVGDICPAGCLDPARQVAELQRQNDRLQRQNDQAMRQKLGLQQELEAERRRREALEQRAGAERAASGGTAPSRAAVVSADLSNLNAAVPARVAALPLPVSIEGWSAERLAQRRRQTARALGVPEVLEESLPGGVTLKLRLIPGGRYRMGSPAGEGDGDEQPRHAVEIQPFYMAETELTQAQWRALMGDKDFYTDGDEHPAERVSWKDAQAFVNKLGGGYRLPSEAQWEYAARAGSAGKYAWGDAAPVCVKGARNGAKFDDNQNCDDTGTEPVGFSAANAFGLRDLHGNVWEWVQDCWHADYQGAPVDGSVWEQGGDCDNRVLRGGSWVSGPGGLRAASRYGINPAFRGGDFGFRVVRSAP